MSPVDDHVRCASRGCGTSRRFPGGEPARVCPRIRHEVDDGGVRDDVTLRACAVVVAEGGECVRGRDIRGLRLALAGMDQLSLDLDARPLVPIDAVADRLGVTVRHVRRLVDERRIPYLKWGKLLRFDPVEIDAWLDQARRGAD